MNADDIWRGRTDDEVLAAYAQLDDYTDEGQQILKSELERRQLAPPEPQASPEPDAATTLPDPLPDNPIARLWSGGYSLPLSYWGWGQGGTFVWGIIFAMLPLVSGAPGPIALLVRFLFVLGFGAYLVIAGVGIWRSAGYYKGSPGWAVVARVAVAAPLGMLVMRIIYAVFGPGNP